MFHLGKIRLVTFDAFGTLFTFRQPIAKTYALMALKYGLSLNPESIHNAFVNAMKSQSRSSPNFGSNSSISSEEWWSQVIDLTLSNAAPASIDKQVSKALPSLTKELYAFYRTRDAYSIFDDVIPTLETLSKNNSKRLGVISNCDERIHDILKALGLSKYFLFVAGSREVGFEKPDRRIFQYARERSSLDKLVPVECLHIGDDERKDFEGALADGWNAFLLDRRVSITSDSDVSVDPSLQQLQQQKPHVIGSLANLCDK